MKQNRRKIILGVRRKSQSVFGVRRVKKRKSKVLNLKKTMLLWIRTGEQEVILTVNWKKTSRPDHKELLKGTVQHL